MTSFSDALDLLKIHVLLTVSGATLAPQVFDPRVNPAANMADGLSFAIPATKNTGQYRDTSEVRVDHTVTIGFAHQMVMSDQYTSTKAAIDREERIIAATGQASSMVGIRVGYSATRRTLTPTREWLIVEIDFVVTHDHTRAP